jgi:undecaprenyl diphosphate synthase
VGKDFTMQSCAAQGLHAAIIMDGNGRWATERGLPRVAGHRAGIAAVRRVIEHAPLAGITRLTLYAFSSDNWKRPAAEVESLFWLLRAFLRLETARLGREGARLEAIGRRDRMPAAARKAIERAERATAGGTRIQVRVAIDYSARDAIARAAVGLSGVDGIGPETMRELMDRELTGGVGAVDLLIRTGGEKRLSDFLLWESAYAELVFTDCLWPDFGAAELEAAVAEFRGRERRFGAVPAPAWPVREKVAVAGNAR